VGPGARSTFVEHATQIQATPNGVPASVQHHRCLRAGTGPDLPGAGDE
jgi:hypothetical protein